ncbi:hypothetical protein TSMEX_011558, partial [Taenia solium]
FLLFFSAQMSFPPFYTTSSLLFVLIRKSSYPKARVCSDVPFHSYNCTFRIGGLLGKTNCFCRVLLHFYHMIVYWNCLLIDSSASLANCMIAWQGKEVEYPQNLMNFISDMPLLPHNHLPELLCDSLFCFFGDMHVIGVSGGACEVKHLSFLNIMPTMSTIV